MVCYLKNHLLWSMIKLDQNIDNLYDVVEKSTEVRTFGFSENGNSAEKMSSDVSYRLSTQEENTIDNLTTNQAKLITANKWAGFWSEE